MYYYLRGKGRGHFVPPLSFFKIFAFFSKQGIDIAVLLGYASTCGRNTFLPLTIRKGNNMNINYELHQAVHSIDLPKVKDLINAGADINNISKHGFSVLVNAVLNEEVDIVTYLINAGADVNYLDEEGKTALMYAIQGGRSSIVKCLIEAGADINIVGRNHRTAEMMALRYGQENDNYEMLDFFDKFNKNNKIGK